MPISIHHFGVHNAESGQPVAVNSNAGDTLLFQATRDLWEKFMGQIDWKFEALWKALAPEKISELNQNNHAVLIGGGGLFLRDQAGADASRSGWQWNTSPHDLEQIHSPIMLFGVGYNRFRHQPDFDPVFSEHITKLVEKSIFFGLRNSGSRYAIRRYIPTSLHHKVKYQPCPTTIASYLYPQYIKPLYELPQKKLVLNAAFDRREMRFEDHEHKILTQIAEVMSVFVKDDWKLVLANHKPQDAEIGRFLKEQHVAYEAVDLSQSYPADIMEFYSTADLTVGMRGHAQMIPFGLSRPIVSIISHDKMEWFLDDIHHPEWGVDIEDPQFKDKLADTMTLITSNKHIQTEIKDAQAYLWETTEKNMQGIKTTLSL